MTLNPIYMLMIPICYNSIPDLLLIQVVFPITMTKTKLALPWIFMHFSKWQFHAFSLPGQNPQNHPWLLSFSHPAFKVAANPADATLNLHPQSTHLLPSSQAPDPSSHFCPGPLRSPLTAPALAHLQFIPITTGKGILSTHSSNYDPPLLKTLQW